MGNCCNAAGGEPVEMVHNFSVSPSVAAEPEHHETELESKIQESRVSFIDEVATEFIVKFQPGPVGIGSKGGLIKKVHEPSQAAQQGVPVGWSLYAVEGEKCSSFDDKVFQDAKNGDMAYTVTLVKVPLFADKEPLFANKDVAADSKKVQQHGASPLPTLLTQAQNENSLDMESTKKPKNSVAAVFKVGEIEQTVDVKFSPLGLKFPPRMPIVVKGFEAGAYGKALGIETDWVLKSLNGEDVLGLQDFEEAVLVMKKHIQPLPLYSPLM